MAPCRSESDRQSSAGILGSYSDWSGRELSDGPVTKKGQVAPRSLLSALAGKSCRMLDLRKPKLSIGGFVYRTLRDKKQQRLEMHFNLSPATRLLCSPRRFFAVFAHDPHIAAAMLHELFRHVQPKSLSAPRTLREGTARRWSRPPSLGIDLGSQLVRAPRSLGGSTASDFLASKRH